MEETTRAPGELDAPRLPPDWFVIVRSVGLGFALAGVIGIGWHRTHQPEPKACEDVRFVTRSGEELHLDPERGCIWVDSRGNPVKGKPDS